MHVIGWRERGRGQLEKFTLRTRQQVECSNWNGGSRSEVEFTVLVSFTFC